MTDYCETPEVEYDLLKDGASVLRIPFCRQHKKDCPYSVETPYTKKIICRRQQEMDDENMDWVDEVLDGKMDVMRTKDRRLAIFTSAGISKVVKDFDPNHLLESDAARELLEDISTSYIPKA